MVLIDAALTPSDPGAGRAAVAVVVDVIRATTTALAALRQGYSEVFCCADVAGVHAVASEIDGAVLAGERECVRIDGFHLGNSPREFSEGEPLGYTLALTTTNGTLAVLRALEEADVVLIGALTNLTAVSAEAARIARAAGGTALVRCAGVRGRVALDDAYAAGRVADELAAYLPEWAIGDGAALARCAARAYDSPLLALGASQSARDLARVGLSEDVRVCARVDASEDIVRAHAAGEGRARLVTAS